MKKAKANKKINWIVFSVIGFVLLVVAALILSLTGNNTYKKLTMEKLESKIANGDTFILYINSRECSHCMAFKPRLNQVIQKYNVEVFGIDIVGLKSSDLQRLKEIAPYEGTPTTVFIVDGKEKDTNNRILGNQPVDTVIGKFRENGYIKQDAE